MLGELAADPSPSHCFLGKRTYGAQVVRAANCFGACRAKREFGFGGSCDSDC